eukprot:comp24333_c4_seq5/m.46053 comp24333_c4_seq5/g.46053  ORF comp24333_c4_seq5/g.46053 comp24333_c4_seq5/m.46053 type:complete len:276 (-) comp24333_c4_seq5:295-1122(-)
MGSQPPTQQKHSGWISRSWKKAEELLTDATRYLGQYDIKKAQNTLTALHESLEEKKATLLPQKKFAFKARPRPKKVEASEPNTHPQTETTNSSAAPATNHTSFENTNAVVISDQSNSTIDKAANVTDGKDVVLRNLSGCKIFLSGRVGAVRADGLRDCTVVVGTVEGSVLMHECRGCVFYLGCRQLRVHTTTSCDFYLDIHSHPIIEDCSGLRFGPLCAQPSPLQPEAAQISSTCQSDLWRRVNDFKWLRSDTLSPNWAVIPEGDRLPAPRSPIS